MQLQAGESAANVHRLQPLRVLLSSRDRRFVRVTSFLLARKGYDVLDAAPADAVDAAARHRADVVLLEGGGSRASAAKYAAALAALASSPGLLVVTPPESKQPWAGLRTVEKWAPLDALVHEIESVSLHRPTPLVD
jgi:poly(3-hydroxybutyrate) depolymerase